MHELLWFPPRCDEDHPGQSPALFTGKVETSVVLGEEVMAVATVLEPGKWKGPRLGWPKAGNQANDYSLEMGEWGMQVRLCRNWWEHQTGSGGCSCYFWNGLRLTSWTSKYFILISYIFLQRGTFFLTILSQFCYLVVDFYGKAECIFSLLKK